MNPLLLGELVSFGKDIAARLFPDEKAQAAERANAEFEMAKMLQDGRFEELSVRMSAIIAEAQAADPWTSRARPSFLYVMYVMILGAVPMGFVAAVNPAMALAVAEGMKAWLAAIPEDLWILFGAGYLGYSYVRTQEKKTGVTK